MTRTAAASSRRPAAAIAFALLAALSLLGGAARAQTYSVLHSFGLADGANPDAGCLVQGPDGTLYGTTVYGGAPNGGTVFQITPNGQESVLYSFGAASDGTYPQGSLVFGPDGALYGTTVYGGTLGAGAVFRITTAGHESIVCSFGTTPNDGTRPVAGLVFGPDGTLYGTTEYGGVNRSVYSFGVGTLFKVTPDGQESVVYSFGAGAADGTLPYSAPVFGPDGALYGVTYQGGTTGRGTVFRITTDGQETVLHTFGLDAADGQYPNPSLTFGLDGSLYGTTFQGGYYDAAHQSGYGTIFQFAPDGTYSVLYSFGTLPNEGLGPNGDLAFGPDGALYGTTLYGGAYHDSHGFGEGTLFKVTLGGQGTLLHSFGADAGDGVRPQAGVAFGSDGTLYGTTYYGGPNHDSSGNGYGVVFALAPAPALTSLSPSSAPAGSPTLTLTLTGKGFVSGATARWNGAALATTFVSATHLTALVPASLLASPGPASVTVSIPVSGGGTPAAQNFTVQAVHIGTATAVSAGADGYTRILWDRSDGMATVWKVSAQGQLVTQQHYGPYAGWTAKAISTGLDNQTRVLWTNTDGRAAYWLLDANSNYVGQQQYGPYAGWTAAGVAAAPDGTSRALWTNSDGTATVWTLDSGSNYAGQRPYGPYAGWAAKSLTVGPDGTERLLWAGADGRAAFWRLNSGSQYVDQRQYGPYAGWTAGSIAAAPDGTSRVAWVSGDGRLALWNVDAANAYTGQAQYGPFGGWSFQGISVGADGNARLLWDNVGGQMDLWDLTPAGQSAAFSQFGPY